MKSKLGGNMKKIRITILAIISFLILSFMAVPTATALSITPYACMDMGWHYRTFNIKDHFQPTTDELQSVGPSTLRMAITDTQTFSKEFNFSFAVNFDLLKADVEAKFGGALTWSDSSTIKKSFESDPIPAGKMGHVEYGNVGVKFDFEKYYLNSYCQKTQSFTEHITHMSAGKWRFKYWITDAG